MRAWFGAVALLAVGVGAQVATQPRQRPPAPAPPSALQSVQVSLYEWGISVTPNQLHVGKIAMEVRNTGTMNHALAVEGTSLRTQVLRPGASTVLTVEPGPGTYVLYCPLDGHREKGMTATVVVRDVPAG